MASKISLLVQLVGGVFYGEMMQPLTNRAKKEYLEHPPCG